MANRYPKPYVARQDATVTTPKAASKEEPGLLQSMVDRYGPAIPALLSNNPYTMSLMALYDYEHANRPEAYDPNFAVTGPTEISQYETPRQRVQSGKEDLVSMYGGEDPGMLVIGGAGAHSIEQLWGKAGKEALPKIREMRKITREPKSEVERADRFLGLSATPTVPKLTGVSPEDTKWRQGIEWDRAEGRYGISPRYKDRSNAAEGSHWASYDGYDGALLYPEVRELKKLGYPIDVRGDLLGDYPANKYNTESSIRDYKHRFGGFQSEMPGSIAKQIGPHGEVDYSYHSNSSAPQYRGEDYVTEFSVKLKDFEPKSQAVIRSTINHLKDVAKTEVGSGGDLVLPSLYATGPRKWLINWLLQKGINTQEEAIRMLQDPAVVEEISSLID